MQKKFKAKYNESCLKIFNLLKLLYANEAEYDKVMEVLNGTNFEEDLQYVTLNKYLNTLKVFGIKIDKINNKYVMRSVPFPLDFSQDDLKAVYLFRSIQKILPDGKTNKILDDLLTSLETKLDSKSQLIYKNLNIDNQTDYSFYYSDIKKQIELCEKYCNENYKINLKYLKNNQEINTFCNAKQIIYDTKNAYLRIYKIKENEIEDVKISSIISIEQLPLMKNNAEVTTTVVYTLKGRLAKAYKPKENEYISKVNEDSIVVVNKNEPIDELLKRLMKYDFDCVINTPKSLQKRMLSLINKTLQNYQ